MKNCLKLLPVDFLRSNFCDFLVAKRTFLLLISSSTKSTVAEILTYAATAATRSPGLE